MGLHHDIADTQIPQGQRSQLCAGPSSRGSVEGDGPFCAKATDQVAISREHFQDPVGIPFLVTLAIVTYWSSDD